jgi:hypothetical protein
MSIKCSGGYVEVGLKIQLWHKPPLVNYPIHSSDCKAKADIIQEEVMSMLRKEALKEVKGSMK